MREDEGVEPPEAELNISPQWQALAAEVQASDLEDLMAVGAQLAEYIQCLSYT